MSRPRTRDDLPPRQDGKRKRRLDDPLPSDRMSSRFKHIRYGGSPKHKGQPQLFGLEPFRGDRGDATLCDRDAKFNPADMPRIAGLLCRTRRAALVGSLLRTVDDNGWIYELQVTNAEQNEHHGYPLLVSDPFAEKVAVRFAEWAEQAGSAEDRRAAQACRLRYGLLT